jgi:hypothetical protein
MRAMELRKLIKEDEMRVITSCEQNEVAGGLPSVFWGLVSNAVYDFITETDWAAELGHAYEHHSYGYYGPGGNWLPR